MYVHVDTCILGLRFGAIFGVLLIIGRTQLRMSTISCTLYLSYVCVVAKV